MKFRIRHILSKTIIILLVLFVALPCSVKREIKQALNVPVADWGSTGKAKPSSLCQGHTKELSQTSSISFAKKELKANPVNVFFSFQQALTAYPHHSSFSRTLASSGIPIYQLHRQYLI